MSEAASGLDPSVVVLDKGLDLVSAKLLAPPGSLLSCLNYEIADTMGLSRISGYEPYDGRTSPALTSEYYIQFASDPSLAVGDTIVTRTLPVQSLGGTSPVLPRTIVVGTVTGIEGSLANTVTVMVINSDYFSNASVLEKLDLFTATTTVLPVVSSYNTAYSWFGTASDYTTQVLTTASTLRSFVSDLSAPAAGLHRFRDTLHAVAGARVFRLVTGNGDASWTLNLNAGDTVGASIGTQTAYVLSISDPVVEGSVMAYYIQVSESEGWQLVIDVGTYLTGATASGGTTANVLVTSVGTAAADAGYLGGILWYCKDIQTWLDDSDPLPILQGWQPIHLGGSIGFTTGSSATESPARMEAPSSSSEAASTYYAKSGANEFSFQLVSIFKDSGTFIGGDAVGTFQIRNIRLVAGTVMTLDNTFDVYTGIGGTGTKLADLTDTYAHNQLEVSPEMAQANTRYEFITTNFYAQDTYDAFYGVNGIGRAFYYNGSIFAHIYTQADATKDKPRHLENHMMHLALSFKEGSVQLSVVGEPTNFSGDDGASEFGVGDRITGLMTLNGTTLGVFCEQSVWSITGSTVDNFTQGILIPRTGCLEYTLVGAGVPVYCNSSGIMTLAQSEKYGDFTGEPLSKEVNTWLRPRLKRTTAASFEAPAVIGALVCRTKNQYRLYFRDGAVLTMTITPEGPKFTMQEYIYMDGESPRAMTPFAWCSLMDSNGEERMNFSYYDPSTGFSSPFVYELDKGWGFAGEPIEHEFELNWFAGASPVNYIGVHKVRMYGTSRGAASLKIAANGDMYDDEYNTAEEYIDLPKVPVKFTELAKPVTNMASLANRGLSIQLKVTNRTLTVPEPFHTCQVLVLQTKQGGQQDA